MKIQNSSRSFRESNVAVTRAWKLLGRALREVPADGRRRRAMEGILDLALEATSCERAFVVTQAESGPCGAPQVEVMRCRRPDGRSVPSRTVLARALAGQPLTISFGASGDARINTGDSVRSLDLRLVATVPLRLQPPSKSALVLDGSTGRPELARDLEELVLAFGSLCELVLHSAVGGHPARSACPPGGPEWVGRSPVFRRLLERVGRLASCDLPVLVQGETGSGKEGAARLLHDRSPRAARPFVAVNCAAFPETLLESELFGAVRGAYTGLDRDRRGLFRQADGGTLLLDEVGDMSFSMQAKLLRVLQESSVRPLGSDHETSVDVRILGATHRDLDGLRRGGRFRADLYYRLTPLTVRVPPLRERLEDLPLLIDHLGRRLNRRSGLPLVRWHPAAISRMRAYSWPGNIRELEAVVARATLACRSGTVQRGDVVLPEDGDAEQAVSSRHGLERGMILSALEETDGVMTRAAARIGWSRQKLARRMQRLGIKK